MKEHPLHKPEEAERIIQNPAGHVEVRNVLVVDYEPLSTGEDRLLHRIKNITGLEKALTSGTT